MFEPFSTKCRLFREVMSLREIFTFFEKHAKNLNARSEKFGELGLTTGI
jgi:hypothetical protein